MKNKIEKELDTKELNDVISLSKKILKILYFVFIACLILASIIAIQKLNILNILLDFLSVISPFFIGFVLAWYLRPLALKLSEKIHSKTISAIIIFASFILILSLLLYIFIPTVYDDLLILPHLEWILRKIYQIQLFRLSLLYLVVLAHLRWDLLLVFIC